MKKFLVSFLAVFILAVLIMPQNSSAITAGELKEQIELLKLQIEALQKQLSQVEDNEPPEWCYDFKKNLRIGDTGEDIDGLNQALVKEGFLEEGSIEHSINFEAEFTEETASAVVAFQEKYADEILKPYRLKRGTGFVGKTTRAKLNELYGCNSPTPVPTPIISIKTGIFVNSPQYNEVVSSPLKITGYVNGNNGWGGFEGQVGNVELLDNNGNKLASAILEATTDWMKFPTNFSAVLNFDSPAISNGKLVFRNEDPSGRDLKTFKIPVRFKKESTNNQPPVIYGVSGPQSLNVNQQGTWTVKASDSSGGSLIYSADWGDQPLGEMYTATSRSLSPAQQSVTFTHSYLQAGTYTPTFTVTNEKGRTAKTSLSVNVGNVITPTPIPFVTIYSISPLSASEGATVIINGNGFKSGASALFNPPEGPSIKASGVSSNGTKLTFVIPAGFATGTYRVAVTNLDGTLNSNEVSFTVSPPNTTPSITVLSPNGGERWQVGTNHQIQFKIAENESGYVDLLIFSENNESAYVFNDFFENKKLSAGIYTSNWTIPQNVLTGKYIAKVYLKTLPVEGKVLSTDQSDAPFNIAAQ